MRVLDLFCGAAGGWSLGLHRAGYRTVAAAEADPWRRAAFLHNNPGVEMFEDVRAVTARTLRGRLGYLPEVIVGSPPCQDASSANRNGKGLAGERTGLFFEAIRIVGECRPVWCCFENVPGIRARGIDRVLVGLEAVGYTGRPLVVGAVHAGANHRRQRVWIVANADERRDGPRRAWGEGPGRIELGEGEGCSDAANAHAARLEILGGEPGDAESQCAAAERDSAGAWDSWNGSYAARSGGLDDGLPRGLARDCLAAYGDAVVPQITEAIGRVMSRLCPMGQAA